MKRKSNFDYTDSLAKRKSAKAPTVNLKKQKQSNLNGGSVPRKLVSFSSNIWNIQEIADDESEVEALEQKYEEQKARETSRKTNRLPIKTGDGLLHSVELEEPETLAEELDDEEESDNGEEEEEETKIPETVTAMQLFSTQSKVLEEKKIQIGSLSAGILEHPDAKIHNFKTLFNIMNSNDSGDFVTVKKLAVVSLLEVFKDLLPEYNIKQSIDKGVKLKKETLRLEKFEVSLLQYYKKFLQTLERLSLILIKKKGPTSRIPKPELMLGELSVSALCDLLQTHAYFNYAENVAQTIVPFLNHRLDTVRQKVSVTCKNIFKDDKKGEITLKILRLINQFAKKHNSIHPDMIEVLLALRIKDINLDEERENLLKQKKLQAHKSNVLQLSKMERKRKARLEHLEKELLEAKAEENKQMKKKHQTEITKVAFGLFFRMLKNSQNSKVLGVCLQGIAKFAHCINIEFYVDLINILNVLLKADWLDFCEQQRCIQTVFVILSQQGEILNLDPTRFYIGAYENLLKLHASKNYKDFFVVLETLTYCLVKRHKKISIKRMASFAKRITTLSLQVLHNGTLGCLGIVKSLLQLNKALDILLDMESSPGDGKYLPELNDPEYCNASATALYELSLLRHHYHPTVAEYSKYIGLGVPAVAENALAGKYGRTTAEEMYETYDMATMAFYPPVPIQKKVDRKARIKYHEFVDVSFKEKCIDVLKGQSLANKSC